MCRPLVTLLPTCPLDKLTPFIYRAVCSSMKAILGADIPRAQVLVDYAAGIVRAIPHTHWPTAVVSAVSLVLLLALQRAPWSKSLPVPLQVTAISIVVFLGWMKGTGVSGTVTVPSALHPDWANSTVTRYEGPSGIQLVGEIPESFPPFKLPRLPVKEVDRFLALFTTALTVSFVGFIESISVAQTYAVKHGYEISAASELKALGAVNALGSTFGAFPVMAAFGRSSVCDNAGARSPLAQAISALTVLLLLLYVTPALFYLPQAVLSAIIVVAVSGLIDVREAARLWRVDRRDFVILVASFLATVFLGVLYGVVIAIGFSLVIFVGAATRPRVEELGRVRGSVHYRGIGQPGVLRLHAVKALRFHAPLWFANCAVLRDKIVADLLRRRTLPPRLQWAALVLDCSAITSIDSTSLSVLRDVVTQVHEDGVPVILAGMHSGVEDMAARSGLLTQLGGLGFTYRTVHDAVRAVVARDVTADMLPHPPTPAPPPPTPSAAATPDADDADAAAPDRGGWWRWLTGAVAKGFSSGGAGVRRSLSKQAERTPLLPSATAPSASGKQPALAPAIAGTGKSFP